MLSFFLFVAFISFSLCQNTTISTAATTEGTTAPQGTNQTYQQTTISTYVSSFDPHKGHNHSVWIPTEGSETQETSSTAGGTTQGNGTQGTTSTFTTTKMQETIVASGAYSTFLSSSALLASSFLLFRNN